MRPLLNQIIEADCLDAIRALPARSVDLVLWDPPYQVTDATWDGRLPWHELWAEIERVLTEDGCAAINACGRFTFELMATKGEWFRWRWFWRKSQACGAHNARLRPMSVIEEVLVFARRKARYLPQMRPGIGFATARWVAARACS